MQPGTTIVVFNLFLAGEITVSVVGRKERMLKHHDLQMFGLKRNKYEVVSRRKFKWVTI